MQTKSIQTLPETEALNREDSKFAENENYVLPSYLSASLKGISVDIQLNTAAPGMQLNTIAHGLLQIWEPTPLQGQIFSNRYFLEPEEEVQERGQKSESHDCNQPSWQLFSDGELDDIFIKISNDFINEKKIVAKKCQEDQSSYQILRRKSSLVVLDDFLGRNLALDLLFCNNRPGNMLSDFNVFSSDKVGVQDKELTQVIAQNNDHKEMSSDQQLRTLTISDDSFSDDSNDDSSDDESVSIRKVSKWRKLSLKVKNMRFFGKLSFVGAFLSIRKRMNRLLWT